MLRSPSKHIYNPFKLRYLGSLSVNPVTDVLNEVFSGTLDETIVGYDSILVCGNDWGPNYTKYFKSHAEKYNKVYDDSICISILPVSSDGSVSLTISDTDFNDNRCSSAYYVIDIIGNKIDVYLSKRTSGSVTSDSSSNSIIVYGLGEKKLSFFLDNSSLFKLKGGELSLLRETKLFDKCHIENNVILGPIGTSNNDLIWDDNYNIAYFTFYAYDFPLSIEITVSGGYAWELINSSYKIIINVLSPVIQNDSLLIKGNVAIKLLYGISLTAFPIKFSIDRCIFNVKSNVFELAFTNNFRRNAFNFKIKTFPYTDCKLSRRERDESLFGRISNINSDGTQSNIEMEYIGLPNTQRQKKPRVNKQYFTSFSYKIGGGVNVA